MSAAIIPKVKIIIVYFHWILTTVITNQTQPIRHSMAIHARVHEDLVLRNASNCSPDPGATQ